MGKTRKKYIRPKLGDVFEISLPNETYAYCRLIEETCIQIYDFISKVPNNPPIGHRDFLFQVGVFKDILTQQIFKRVGTDPLTGEEKINPLYVYDKIYKKYKIYEDEHTRPATKEECIGLERFIVWDWGSLKDRILHGTKPGHVLTEDTFFDELGNAFIEKKN